MIAVIYFTKPIGGMHNYANLLTEGYRSNNITTNLFNYFRGNFDYYKQTFKLFLGIKSEIENWYKKNKMDEYQIIHFTDTPIYLALFLDKIYNPNLKYIITIHDPDPHPEKNWMKRIKFTLLIKLNNHLISISKKKRNVFIHLHSKNQATDINLRYIFSKHPISNSYKSYEKITHLTQGRPLSILFIGRLEYYKGIDIFINSVKYYNKNYNTICKFTIAGKGEMDHLPYFDKEINLINKFLSDDEFLNLMEKSHIIVFPYRQGTQSGVLNLAISLNKPVIVSNVGTFAEYVEHLKTGILLNHLSDKNLADTYNLLVKNPDLIFSMSKCTLELKKAFYSNITAQEILFQLQDMSK